MLPYERQKELLALFKVGQILHPEEIMGKFGVSIATARRDLSMLAELPNIKKVYGGAVMVAPEPTDAALAERTISHTDEKERIGLYCAGLVQDGDVVLLDNGTTPLYIAKHIKNRPVTVLTNSLLVLDEMADGEADVIVLGGKLKKKERSITGYNAVRELHNYNITRSFVSTSGVSVSNGISDYNQDEIEIKREVIARSAEVYIITDNSKFNYVAPRHLCDLKDVTCIITDTGLDVGDVQRYRDAGAQLVLV